MNTTMNTTIERPDHEITSLRNALHLAESAAAAALNERDVLARWKKEALVHMRKWDAVDEAVREHPDTLVGHNITDTTLRFIRERDEARQQLEAMHEAIVQLRDSLEVGKDSVETWDWCNTTLANPQPPTKP